MGRPGQAGNEAAWPFRSFDWLPYGLYLKLISQDPPGRPGQAGNEAAWPVRSFVWLANGLYLNLISQEWLESLLPELSRGIWGSAASQQRFWGAGAPQNKAGGLGGGSPPEVWPFRSFVWFKRETYRNIKS